MDAAEWISLGALLISAISLGLSCFAVFIDRSRVKSDCRIVNRKEADDSVKPEVVCRIRNHGRHPIILIYFGWESESSEAYESIIPKSISWNEGDPPIPNDWQESAQRPEVRVVGGDSFEKRLPQDSPNGVDGPAQLNGAVRFFFESATGRRYRVKGSERIIREYSDWVSANI